ncbi:MAG: prepilin-type N-terminal cleavage/methylation domain-containing protein [Phycisphaerales bacterium]|nr:MAG: prepilin-type N-terminal cleavage/methylation domain-containing protein [Phycisphaerales bacterium]
MHARPTAPKATPGGRAAVQERAAISQMPGRPATPRRTGFTLLEVLVAVALLAALSAAALPPMLALARQRAADESAAQFQAAATHARLDAQRTGRPVLLVIRETHNRLQQLVAIPLETDEGRDDPGLQPDFEPLASTRPDPRSSAPQNAEPDTQAALAQVGRVLLTLPRDVSFAPGETDDRRSAPPGSGMSTAPGPGDDPRADLLGTDAPLPRGDRADAARPRPREPLPPGGLPIAVVMPDGSFRALTPAVARGPGGREAEIRVARWPGAIRLAWAGTPSPPDEPSPPTLDPRSVDDPRFAPAPGGAP